MHTIIIANPQAIRVVAIHLQSNTTCSGSRPGATRSTIKPGSRNPSDSCYQAILPGGSVSVRTQVKIEDLAFATCVELIVVPPNLGEAGTSVRGYPIMMVAPQKQHVLEQSVNGALLAPDPVLADAYISYMVRNLRRGKRRRLRNRLTWPGRWWNHPVTMNSWETNLPATVNRAQEARDKEDRITRFGTDVQVTVAVNANLGSISLSVEPR